MKRAASRTKTKAPTSRRPLKSEIASRIKPVAKAGKPRSSVIYGRSGTGKTTLACSWPGPKLLIDIKDEGTDSVSDLKDVDVLEVEEWSDLDDIYWMLKDGSHKYRTVIIDTLTQAQSILVNEIAGHKVKSGKAAGDWGTMSKQDWGEVSSRLKTLVSNFRDLPMEVVFIAQDRVFNIDEEADDNALEPEIGPRLMPSVRDHVCAAVSLVGHTFIRENITKKKVKGREVERRSEEYCLRLGPNAYYITKLRKPIDVELPEFLTNPTYEDIVAIITGE